ncbi:histidine phosphatase family protein [Thalassovita sp.]|uniref:SixA phosphatase family protein n=1 Tax=Thalassovita sp. TaxID=1979401 RepID=UPI002B27A88B|nr:histidine phosphatase family protein [Thalassovita sp.]
MTLRLILMRHAKSGWDDPSLSDHDRPLNKRGRLSATALGGWLRGRGYLPDLVLCSDAVRTRETLDRLNLGAKVRLLPQLYLAPPGVLMQQLQQAEQMPTILMIAHNPGIADFAAALTAAPGNADFLRYPTGATSVIDLPIADWGGAKTGTGRLVDFIIPRQLI